MWDWTELQHIDPHFYGHNSISFPFSWAAQPGAWGPSLSGTWSSFQYLLYYCSEALNSNCSTGGPEGSLCWVLVLSTASYLQLTRTSCAPSYIIVLRPLNSTCRQSRLSPWYLRPDAPVIYTDAFPILTARSGSICNTVTISWCYVITRECWFCVHFIKYSIKYHMVSSTFIWYEQFIHNYIVQSNYSYWIIYIC